MRAIFFVFLLLGSLYQSTHATMISHAFTNVAGNTWQAEYEVNNNSLPDAIYEFTIWYEFNIYENISVVATPADWDPLVVQPDPGLPDDGFFDALALGAVLTPGASLGGFIVQFDLIVGQMPSSHFYEAYWDTFSNPDTGFTVAAVTPPPNPTGIPEPSSSLLFMLGCLGLATRKCRLLGK
ncbi:MAG: PEP-CTERM sorting domain-containing protein [Pseudomonadota bacterium]